MGIPSSLFFSNSFIINIFGSSHTTLHVAQALRNSFDISVSQLPRPCLKDYAIKIKISEEECKKGLESYNKNLHGRLILAKGDKPIKSKDLQSKLAKLWKPIGQWKMNPLEKGFYKFNFSSLEDLQNVWVVGA